MFLSAFEAKKKPVEPKQVKSDSTGYLTNYNPMNISKIRVFYAKGRRWE